MLASILGEEGFACQILNSGPEVREALSAIPEASAHIHLVDLRGLDCRDPEACSPASENILELVRDLVSAAKSNTRFWIITRGAQSTMDAATVSIWQAPLWGLGRALSADTRNFGEA